MNVESLPPNIEEIRKFAKEIKLDVKYFLGEMHCGDLWVDRVKTLPENITFNVVGSLGLESVRCLPKNIIFNVCHYLYLNSVETIHSSVQFVDFVHLVLPEDRKVKIIW